MADSEVYRWKTKAKQPLITAWHRAVCPQFALCDERIRNFKWYE